MCCQSCDPSTSFQCLDTGNCIPLQLQCDDVTDCPDGSDEFECRGKTMHTIAMYISDGHNICMHAV